VTHETPHQTFDSGAYHDNLLTTQQQLTKSENQKKDPRLPDYTSIKNNHHEIYLGNNKMPSSDSPIATEAPMPEATKASQPQKEKKGGAGKPAKEPVTPTDTPKLSGAELKKKAKEEKAARRAQALQDKQSGGAAPSPATPSGPTQKSEPQKGQKGVQKRRESTAGESRNMAIRGSQKAAPVVDAPKEEDKTVEFFRHLYKTRTTSIAGAGKEVHPAVLALGLQMSNYTICGSCARLVATLQAFKRVSLVPLRLPGIL
jgi:translation initiation factor eIF-2B subunit delta